MERHQRITSLKIFFLASEVTAQLNSLRVLLPSEMIWKAGLAIWMLPGKRKMWDKFVRCWAMF